MDYIKQLNAFWDKCEDDMDLKPSSSIVYLALLQINNRSGWKDRFRVAYGQIITMTGVAKNTYYSAIKELVEGGYLIYEKAPNQYQSAFFQIIMLYQNLVQQRESIATARGTALRQQGVQHCDSKGYSIENILKPYKTLKPIKHKTNVEGNKFSPPTHTEVFEFFESKISESNWTNSQCDFQAKKYLDFYESKNWMVGKNKMSKWKSSAAGWLSRWIEQNQNKPQLEKGVIAALSSYNRLKK